MQVHLDDHQVHRKIVPTQATTAARRRLLLEIRRCGVSAQDIAHWSMVGWWPTLRDEPEILAVRQHLERFKGPDDVWAQAQILLRLPDEDDVVLGPPHVDTLPEWAHGTYSYKRILSVELTNTPLNGGGTVLHLPDGLVPIQQGEGDVLSLHPSVPHSGSPNHSGDARLALFFRVLEPV